MYQVKRTKKYDRSFRRLQRAGKVKPEVFQEVEDTILRLTLGQKLDTGFRDHALWGEYAGHRECHIQGDLLLVYKIEEEMLILILADIGSHSYLFG